MPNQTTDPNSKALDAVAKLIDNLDPAIQRFDDLNQQKAELETLLVESQQLEKKTLADETLSHDLATERLVNARAKSDVLRVRVESLGQKIADELKSVISARQLAQSAGFGIWHQLHQHRIQRSHEIFQAQYTAFAPGVHCLDTRPETPDTFRGKSYRLTGRRFLGFLRRRLNFGQAGQAM